MKNIERIIDFAKNKFDSIQSNKKRVIISTKNLYSLMSFIKESKIDVSEFDITDYFNIVSNSTEISNMVGSLLKHGDYQELLSNDFFYGLATSYADINDIELKDDTENYAEFLLTEEPKKNRDIDSTREFLNSLADYPVYTADEEREMFLKYKNATSEQEKEEIAGNIVSHNLKLVVSIAKRYVGRGLDFDDLIQEGSLGLMTAIPKFKLEAGCKFSTYATWWVRQAVTRGIADLGNTIRKPVHTVERINKVLNAEKELTFVLGKEPTSKELADYMGMSVKDVDFFKINGSAPTSIDSPIKAEDGSENSTLSDYIVDTSVNDNYFMYNVCRQELMDILENSTLTDREKYVICERFGLISGEGRILESIGNELGVTRERIRQIEAKAFRKLRRNQAIKEFETKDFSLYEYDPYLTRAKKR